MATSPSPDRRSGIPRPFWTDRLRSAWRHRPIAWLAGVRRTGKTTIARQLPGTVFLNGDLPSVVHRCDDPEGLFGSMPDNSVMVLDEVHRLADYSALSRECDVSRPTVKAHLEAMAVAYALTPVSPFHGGGRRELVRRPTVYGFDTGFVSYVRGWTSVRDEDRGGLWEHLVLDVLRTAPGTGSLAYWRDRSDRVVDFVVPRGTTVDAIECTIGPDRLEARNLEAFRQVYPRGRNFVVAPGVREPYEFRLGAHAVHTVGCADLLSAYR